MELVPTEDFWNRNGINCIFCEKNGTERNSKIFGIGHITGPSCNVNFVQVDVTKVELQEERESRVRDLLSPLQTVLDDSIGCAVWFAARGRGELINSSTTSYYTSPCRALLLGMGPDEQLGQSLFLNRKTHNSLFIYGNTNRQLCLRPVVF